MPERMVKPDILTDEAVDRLSPEAEVFYRRLISVVDDFGRYDGRLTVLLAALYPLRIRTVTEDEIERWLAECADAGALMRYVVDGKPFVAFITFNQRLRAEKSRWPAPPIDSGCRQMPADDGKCPQPPTNAPESETNTETNTESQRNARAREESPAKEEIPAAREPVPEKADTPFTPALPEQPLEPDPPESLGPQFTALEIEEMGRKVLALCGMKSSGWKDDGKAKEIGIRWLTDGVTDAEMAGFAADRKKTPVLNYIEQDFARWRQDRNRSADDPPPLRLVTKPPDGLSPGEQKRWVEEQIRQQKQQWQRTA